MKRILIVLLAMLLILAPALTACEEEKKSSKRDDDDDEDEEVLQDDDESSFDFNWGDESNESDGGPAPEDGETVSGEVSDEISGEVSDEISGETSGEISDEEQSNPDQPKPPVSTFPLEDKYFGETEICVLTRSRQYASQFAGTEEFASTLVDVAVQERNALLKEKYGIVITTHISNRPSTDIFECIMTDSEFYHVVSDAAYFMTQQTIDGYFYSLNDLLCLDQPWWDQSAINQLNLSDRVYLVAGDAIITDDMYTAAVLFNKEAYAANFEPIYGSLYDLVVNGKWTIDVMAEMAKAYSRPDSSGRWMTEGAYYGIVTDGYTGATMLTHGSGAVSACKDAAGRIRLSGADEVSVRAFDKVYGILSDVTMSVYAEQFTPVNYGYISDIFLSGHALFQIAYISSLHSLGEYAAAYECTPGIVPIPKYNFMQEDYYSGINVYQSDVLAIPVCNTSNLEATAYALELLGYYNSTQEDIFVSGNVCVAFYIDALRCQSSMDYNDIVMLDLISNSRIYDIGGAFNWGGNLIGIYSFNLYRGSNTYLSTWDAELPAIQQALEATLEAYEGSIN